MGAADEYKQPPPPQQAGSAAMPPPSYSQATQAAYPVPGYGYPPQQQQQQPSPVVQQGGYITNQYQYAPGAQYQYAPGPGQAAGYTTTTTAVYTTAAPMATVVVPTTTVTLRDLPADVEVRMYKQMMIMRVLELLMMLTASILSVIPWHNPTFSYIYAPIVVIIFCFSATITALIHLVIVARFRLAWFSSHNTIAGDIIAGILCGVAGAIIVYNIVYFGANIPAFIAIAVLCLFSMMLFFSSAHTLRQVVILRTTAVVATI